MIKMVFIYQGMIWGFDQKVIAVRELDKPDEWTQ
jgi:hypothetical protein